MKKIPVTVAIDFPETLEEAIEMYGREDVFRTYLGMYTIQMQCKMRSATKHIKRPA